MPPCETGCILCITKPYPSPPIHGTVPNEHSRFELYKHTAASACCFRSRQVLSFGRHPYVGCWQSAITRTVALSPAALQEVALHSTQHCSHISPPPCSGPPPGGLGGLSRWCWRETGGAHVSTPSLGGSVARAQGRSLPLRIRGGEPWLPAATACSPSWPPACLGWTAGRRMPATRSTSASCHHSKRCVLRRMWVNMVARDGRETPTATV